MAILMMGLPKETVARIAIIAGLATDVLQDLCVYLFISVISLQVLQVLL